MSQFNRLQTDPHLLVCRTGRTGQLRGKALESYIATLFSQIPGLRVVHRNVINLPGSQEIDLVFWNGKHLEGLYFVENFILIECKNTASPVGSHEIREFTTKLHDRHRKFGIFVAMNGITGQPEELTHARDAGRRAFLNGIEVIIFTGEELDRLASTEEFVELLQDKMGLLIATECSI